MERSERRSGSLLRLGSAALCHHVLPVHSRAASKITIAPGTTRANTNSKNGETLVISGTPPARPSLFPPIFLGLAPHRRRGRVLDLEPMVDTAGAIWRTEALGHDALAA
jgi:hypothetical protein